MIRGSCLCKRVRFEIHGKLGRSSHCHCSMCRKATGAAFGTYAEVKIENLKIVSGAEVIMRYRSSPGVERTFCGDCVERVLRNACPNCGGGFMPRPVRPSKDLKGGNYLGKYPASAKVKHRPVDIGAQALLVAAVGKTPPEKR